MAALGAAGIGALTLLPDALEPPEPPPLPPDVGLGPYASSPAVLPTAGERRVGLPEYERSERRDEDERGSKSDAASGNHAPAKPEPGDREPAEPPAPAATTAPVPTPPVTPAPAPPVPVAVSPPPPPSPPVQPETSGAGSEFGFER
jgi:hypothetical protein